MNKRTENKADKRRTFQEVCEDALRVEQFKIDYINQKKARTWAEFVFITMWVNLDYEVTQEVMQ